jgi:type IV secretory pathway TrbL component
MQTRRATTWQKAQRQCGRYRVCAETNKGRATGATGVPAGNTATSAASASRTAAATARVSTATEGKRKTKLHFHVDQHQHKHHMHHHHCTTVNFDERKRWFRYIGDI